jgi:hypothetical protein
VAGLTTAYMLNLIHSLSARSLSRYCSLPHGLQAEDFLRCLPYADTLGRGHMPSRNAGAHPEGRGA